MCLFTNSFDSIARRRQCQLKPASQVFIILLNGSRRRLLRKRKHCLIPRTKHSVFCTAPRGGGLPLTSCKHYEVPTVTDH